MKNKKKEIKVKKDLNIQGDLVDAKKLIRKTTTKEKKKNADIIVKKASVIIVLFILVSCAYSQETANQNISFAVKNSLLQWLEKIPSGDEANYGFQNREEFSHASLGTPIEVFDLGDESYTQTNQATRLAPTGEWRIPVVVDKKSRAMVTVIKQNNTWEIVNFGAAGLAGELNNFANQLTADQFRRIKIFRLYQPLSKFLFYDDPASGPDQIVLLPLFSALDYIESLGLQTTKTWTLSEVLKIMRATVSLQNQEK